MDLFQEFQIAGSIDIYQTAFRLIASVLATTILAGFYRYTHSGISYSASFSFSIIVCGLLAAGVIITVGENVVRAFALVGALAIIRYRTVIKDPKDLSFIFASLVIGMAFGTGLFATAILIETIFIAVSLVLRFGSGISFISDFNTMVRVNGASSMDASNVEHAVRNICKVYQILTVDTSKESDRTAVVIEVNMKSAKDIQVLTSALNSVSGVKNVSIVSGNNSVTY